MSNKKDEDYNLLIDDDVTLGTEQQNNVSLKSDITHTNENNESNLEKELLIQTELKDYQNIGKDTLLGIQGFAST